MQSFVGALRSARRQCFANSKIADFSAARAVLGFGGSGNGVPSLDSGCSMLRMFASSLYSMAAERNGCSQCLQACGNRLPLMSPLNKNAGIHVPQCTLSLIHFGRRSMSTEVNPMQPVSQDASDPTVPVASRIKFKRLDKTARNIMQILDREAVAEVKSQREVPDIKPGYIIQMRVESPENKRRVTTIKGIVIARRNAGLNTTFRLRRLVAGVGVESLFPLYSPNIKEVKVLDKKKVRRTKLY